jgi:hypothetical protein
MELKTDSKTENKKKKETEKKWRRSLPGRAATVQPSTIAQL